MLWNLKLHGAAWKYPRGHTGYLLSRLHHSEESVNKEEKNWAHGLTNMIPVYMKNKAREEEEIQLVHDVERVEVSGANVRNGRECYGDY